MPTTLPIRGGATTALPSTPRDLNHGDTLRRRRLSLWGYVYSRVLLRRLRQVNRDLESAQLADDHREFDRVLARGRRLIGHMDRHLG